MQIDNIKIGEEITLTKYIDKYRPIFYAGASCDFNPIHIDVEFGKKAGLGGNILHGMCTYAFCQQLVVDWCKDPSSLRKLKVKFRLPVKPEDKITIKGKIAKKIENKIIIEISAVNQKGEIVISQGYAEVEIKN